MQSKPTGSEPASAPAAQPEPPRSPRSWPGVLKSDFLASLVVFLVALPLCMGIANACGLPPALGLITGIIGGLVVGFLAGCPLQVSGPAAGLVVTVASIVQEERFGETLPERIAMLGLIVFGA